MGRQKERVSKEASAVEDPKLYYSTEAYEYKVESAEEAKDSKAKPRPRVK